MSRRPLTAEERAKLSLALFDPKCDAPKPPRVRRLENAAMDRAMEDVVRFTAEQDWSQAKGRHWVALFAKFHREVYGVEPADLTPKARMDAAVMAAALVRRHFKEPDEMAEFVWWCWQRERGREKWRRENGRAGGSITWRLQFNGALVTDFRIDRARKAKG